MVARFGLFMHNENEPGQKKDCEISRICNFTRYDIPIGTCPLKPVWDKLR